MNFPEIRVLVVDDSAVVRGLLAKALESDAQLKLAGTAMHGEAALAALKRQPVDVVVLDVEMPVMDGLTALVRIQQEHPGVKVIMASSLTYDGAETTIKALSLGAAGCIAKPVGTSLSQSIAQVAAELVPLVKALGAAKRSALPPAVQSRMSPAAIVPTPRRAASVPPNLLIIGTSTGGPQALRTVLSGLPTDFPLPILIVQHMPPMFTPTLARHLARDAGRPCAEAIHGEPIEAGRTYVAPGDFHLEVARRGDRMTLFLNQNPPEHYCRPSVNPLFRTAADVCGPGVLAVMLTGMGDDGIEGTQSVVARGGTVIAQDEASSVVWGMPGAVVRAGLAHEVVSLAAVAPAILPPLPVGGRPLMEAVDYDFLSNLVLRRSGLALGTGKEYLLEARLVPLAQSWGLDSIPELVRDLRRGETRLESSVVEAMTTNETMFFRDKTPFDELREKLLPTILAARQAGKRLRIWSAAASTGQESYSLAMLLKDSFPDVAADWRIDIIGTDISTQALTRAQTGVYSQLEVQRGLPIQLLLKHFQQSPEGWRVADSLRRWVQFKKLNLLEPFQFLGQFDVILCRNVLIYFEHDLKQHILDRMAKQLAADGVLILGAAESMMGITDAFERNRDCRAAVYTAKSRAALSA